VANTGVRTDIQFLRALAVGLVVADHAGFPLLHGGFVGVDVFFVVSGFLITGLLVREVRSTGRVSIADFYARRARRILPAATVTLVATVLYATWRLPASRVHEIASDSGWAAAFLANVHFARIGTDYFSAERAVSPVQHFWSLAVEEQFYLVWPVTILAVLLVTRGRPAGRRLLVLLVALAWLASLAWSVHLTTSNATAAYFSPLTRTHELATGALLAFAVSRLERIPDATRTGLAAGGLGTIALAGLVFEPTTPFPGAAALLPVLGTAALLAAGTGAPDQGLWRRLAWAPAQWLGDRSYSLYLWHWPVLVLGRPDLPVDGLLGDVLLVALALLLSEASYRWVETPLRHPGFHMLHARRALVLWPAAGAFVAASCLAAVAYADRALESRQDEAKHYYADRLEQREGEPVPAVRAVLREALADADAGAPIPFPLPNLEHLGRDVWQTKYTCYLSWDDTSKDLCPVGDTSSDRTMVVYGDSHAGMWLPALDGIGKRAGIKVVPLVKVGCGPYDVTQLHDGQAYPECPEFRDWAMERIEEIRPDVVVLAARGLWAVQPAAGQSKEKAWQAGMATTLGELEPLADRVVVLIAASTAVMDPKECLTAPEADMASCTGPAETVETAVNPLQREAAKAEGADWVDVSRLLCVQDRCPMVADFLVVYRDKAHITASWGRRVGRELGALLGLEERRRRR